MYFYEEDYPIPDGEESDEYESNCSLHPNSSMEYVGSMLLCVQCLLVEIPEEEAA